MRFFFGPLWWLLWAGMSAARLTYLPGLLLSGSFILQALFISEALALYWGLLNAFRANRRSYSLRGVWVAFAYLAGLVLVPKVSFVGAWAGTVFALAGAGLSCWALFHLRERFSVGPTCWVSLCDSGPYAFVRHPQLAGRLLIILGATLQAQTVAGLLLGLLGVLLTASVVLAEEGELQTVAAWSAYADRVPWRVIPGVL